MLKRVVDASVSVCLVLLLAPLFLLIALFICLDSKGGILFKQTRIGKKGQPFSIYKFRTMVANANQTGPYYTSNNDPRVTKVGRLLRKTSLDELPQLLNIINGDMSLIGPRPDVAEQRNLYTEEEWQLRCSIRPGITGLAQALLRSDATMEQRKEHDLRYIENVNPWLDLKIFIWTINQVVFKGGN